MVENYELPLFPLRTVLFPGQLLPLNVFEARYEQLMDDCLQGDRTFGVALIRAGVEVGGAAVPYNVGTTATIQDVTRLPSGHRHVLARGRDRFRMQGYHSGSKPYLQGRVSLWPWDNSTPPRTELVRAVRRGLERYINLWSRTNAAEVKLDQIPQPPAHLAILTAITLQISSKQKQELLETPSVGELLRHLDDLLRHENRALQIMLASAQRRGEMNGAFSRN
jgi:Lon protease-like protein